MPKKYTQEQIRKKLEIAHNGEVVIDFSEYSGMDLPCKFIDRKYGEFWNNPYNVITKKQGHRKKYIEEKLKKPVELLQKKLDSIYAGNIEVIKETYIASNKKCKFIDKEFGIYECYPHNVLRGQRHPEYKRLSQEECLVLNSPRRNRVKQIILQEKLLNYVCKECGQNDLWNDKKLVLQLDHINGIPTDNRIENLRFLCPNCHSQTESYCRPLSQRKIK